MFLAHATTSLQAILSSNYTTTAPSCLAGYHSNVGAGQSQQTSLTNVAATIVPAPDTGEVEQVDFLAINNCDTAAATVTINYVVSGTAYPVLAVTLQVGDTLLYSLTQGFRVVDSQGRQKTIAGLNNQILLLSVGPAPADAYSSAMTIDVTKSLHVIAASNGTSATSTLTPSAAGNKGDVLVIVTEADSSGTVTVTFASTFHPNGTQATTASHFSTVTFVSDGTRWLEVARVTALS